MPLPNNYEAVIGTGATAINSDGLNTAGYRWSRHEKDGSAGIFPTNSAGLSSPTYLSRRQINTKFDHNFNGRNKLGASYTYENSSGNASGAFESWPGGFRGGDYTHPQTLSLNVTSPLSPRLLMERTRFRPTAATSEVRVKWPPDWVVNSACRAVGRPATMPLSTVTRWCAISSRSRVLVTTSPICLAFPLVTEFTKSADSREQLEFSLSFLLMGRPYVAPPGVPADRVKLLVWDGSGLVLVWKRLEQGAFKWPPITEGVMRLSPAQLAALIEGLDWSRVHVPRIARPKATR